MAFNDEPIKNDPPKPLEPSKQSFAPQPIQTIQPVVSAATQPTERTGAEVEKAHIEAIKSTVPPKDTVEAHSEAVKPVDHSIAKLNVREVGAPGTHSMTTRTAEVTLNFEVPAGKDTPAEKVTESRA